MRDMIEASEEEAFETESEEDVFSDISDNSDIFHVTVKSPDEARTPEDQDLQRIDSIVQHLRDYPLLPPDLSDESKERSFRDVQSGMRLPLLHCGFKGCTWQCSRETEVKWHWDLEFQLSRHLQSVHRHDAMQSVPDSSWHIPGEVHYQMDAYAYYCAAVLKKEEEHVPLIGVSVDRRMLTLLAKLANSDTVQSAVCFVCAQIHTWVESWTKMHGLAWTNYISQSAIRWLKVRDSLWVWEREDREMFLLSLIHI